MHFAVENGRKAGESDEVDRALVDAQLARILSSREFIRSDRMAALSPAMLFPAAWRVEPNTQRNA